MTAGGGNTVLADTEFVGIGLVGLSGSGAEAAVQLGADVTASTDVGTTIASTGVVSVSATGGNTATANSDGGTGGAVAAGTNKPQATIDGAVRATLAGSVSSSHRSRRFAAPGIHRDRRLGRRVGGHPR